MKVFIAEDDFSLSKALSSFFELKGYEVDSHLDGAEAFDALHLAYLADLYIIDINLPGVNGLDLIKQVRKLDSTVPIVVITASIELSVLENAYSFGCSEYIKKPFDLRELDIRINKLLQINTLTQIVITGFKDKLEFDFAKETLIVNNEPYELRKKEIRFLYILLKNHGFVVKTSDIEDFVWEGEIREAYPLRQMVAKLRQKLPADFIKTEVGIGYSTTNGTEGS